MGLTCASLHVWSPAQSPRLLAEDAGRRLAYDLVDNSAEADRQLVAVRAEPWVSFFDLTNPPTVTDEALELGKQLSAGAGGPVLLTSVFDSDGFAFVVFERGKQIDAHASMPGLFPGRLKKWPTEKRAAEWSRLFNRAVSLDDVQALTQKNVLFAEDLLARLCDLIGLSREVAMQTPHDLQARPRPDQQQFNFRSRPKAPGGLRVKQKVPTKNRIVSLTVGLRKEHSISFELNAPAGEFDEPVLEFSGPAVDAGLLELTEGYGLWALGLDAILRGDIRRVNAEVSTGENDGRRVLRVHLKGLSANRFAFPPRKQSILIFWSTFRAIAVGSGELHVSFVPNPAATECLALRPQFLVEI